MLTTALMTCSMIWDTAVGSMVPSPWKYPLKTPRIATMTRPSDRTFKAYSLSGDFIICREMASAPKKISSVTTMPTAADSINAQTNTLNALRLCRMATLAATSLETAVGILSEDSMRVMAYTSKA